MSVSATAFVSKNEMTAPMMTAPTTARMAIVVYWRRMKATAPSKIVPATSSISFVPVSRASTSRARYRAKSTAMMPAGRMINWSVSALIRLSGSSTLPGGPGSRIAQGTSASSVGPGSPLAMSAGGPRRV